MRLQFFIVFLVCHAQLFAGDKDVEVGDTLFVWADNGVMVRRQPSMESEAITKLSYGEQVIVLEVVDREWEYEMLASMKVKDQVYPRVTVVGNFVKINWSGAVGYVYTGLLSRLKPLAKGEGIEAYFSRAFGQVKVVADERHDNSDARFKRILYANGAVFQREHGNENWWSHLYLIPDITLSEAYLLINRLVDFESSYKRATSEQWELVETHPTTIEPMAMTLQTSMFEQTDIKVQPHYILITMSGGN